MTILMSPIMILTVGKLMVLRITLKLFQLILILLKDSIKHTHLILDTYMEYTSSPFYSSDGIKTIHDYDYGYESINLEEAWGRNLGYRHYAIDFDNSGKRIISSNPSLDSDPTTNPFILGWWTRVECVELGNYSCTSVNGKPEEEFVLKDVGIFVDGGDPFTNSDLSAITGSASYSGVIKGLIHNLDDNLTKSLFGDINLDVNFSDENNLGSISGMMNNFHLETGSNVYDTLRGNIILESTDLGSTFIDSRIDNRTTLIFNDGNVSGNLAGRNYDGKWGGRFYGNHSPDGMPETVGGTAAATSSDGEYTIMVPWIADKRP